MTMPALALIALLPGAAAAYGGYYGERRSPSTSVSVSSPTASGRTTSARAGAPGAAPAVSAQGTPHAVAGVSGPSGRTTAPAAAVPGAAPGGPIGVADDSSASAASGVTGGGAMLGSSGATQGRDFKTNTAGASTRGSLGSSDTGGPRPGTGSGSDGPVGPPPSPYTGPDTSVCPSGQHPDGSGRCADGDGGSAAPPVAGHQRVY